MRPCLYFGTFNPIHMGHLAIAQAAYNQYAQELGFHRVTFVPTAMPPHREAGLADSRRRLSMVRLAVADNPAFQVSDIEFRRPGPHYTVETLELIQEGNQPAAFIIGSDSLHLLHTWHRPQELVERVVFLQAVRPGATPVHEIQVAGETLALNTRVIDLPLLEISSTWVREQLACGKRPRYLVSDPVLAYIERNGLYRPV